VKAVHSPVAFGISEAAFDRLTSQAVSRLDLVKVHLFTLGFQSFFALGSLNHPGRASAHN
jgi:hypothetical protein